MGLLEDSLKEDDLSMGLNDTGTGIIAPPRTETSIWREYCRVQGCECGGHMQPGHLLLQTQDITSDIVTHTIKNGTIMSFSRPRGVSQVFVNSADVDPNTKELKPTEVRRIPLGHIPIASLLGEEIDLNFMLPEPTPGSSQSTLSPSAAASTLPTPPPSTASPKEGTFTHSPQPNGDAPAPSLPGTHESLSSTINGLNFEHDDMYKEPTPAPDYMDVDRGDHAPPVSEHSSHSPSAGLSGPSPPAALEPSRGHQTVEPSMAHPSPMPLRTVPPPREVTPAQNFMDVDQTVASSSTSSLTPPTLMHTPSVLSRRAGGQGEAGPSKLLSPVRMVPYRQPSPVPMEVDSTYNTTFPPNPTSFSRPPGAGAETYSTTAASSSSGVMNYAGNTQSHHNTFSTAHVRSNYRPTQSQPGQLPSTPGASTSTAHFQSPPSQFESVVYPPLSSNQGPVNRSVPSSSIPSIIDDTQRANRISVPPPRDQPMPRPQLTDIQTSSSSSYPFPSAPLYPSASSKVQQSSSKPQQPSSKAQQPSTRAQQPSKARANARPERAAIPELVLTTPEVEQQGESAPASPSKPKSPKGKGRLIKEDSNPEPDHHQAASTSSTTRIVRLADHEETESQPTSPVSPVDTGSSSKPLKSIRKFACEVPGCGKTFTRKNDVVRHMKSAAAHRDFGREDPNSVARCGKCNRILSRYDSAKRHEGSSSCGKRVLPSELKTKAAKPKKNRKRGKGAGQPVEDVDGESKED